MHIILTIPDAVNAFFNYVYVYLFGLVKTASLKIKVHQIFI